METALDTPRFGIVVSLSVDSRSSTANSSTVPRFIEGFRERDKFLRIISAGLCFSDTFYQEETVGHVPRSWILSFVRIIRDAVSLCPRPSSK